MKRQLCGAMFVGLALGLAGTVGAAEDAPGVLNPPAAEQGVRAGLLPIPAAELATAEAEVRGNVAAARARMVTVLKQAESIDETKLAETYGELGAMYHAHSVYIPAVPCYRNAELLQPGDFRWPYYLGYLYQNTSQPQEAVDAYQRALAIRPDDPFARLRLGQVYLVLNQPELAEELLNQVVDTPSVRGAALEALGRMATARRDYPAAVRWLEQALEENPRASRIHYPLAMAYRGLGDVQQAKQHLLRYGSLEPVVQDPLVAELDALMTGTRTQFYRGIEAVYDHKYDEAVAAFRAGLEREPNNVNARISLARALYLGGDREEAYAELERTLELAPRSDLAQFLTALYLDEAGRFDEAETHYRAALAVAPLHAGANFFLGNLLMRSGRYTEAARHYAETLRKIPKHPRAGTLEVLALARDGASPEVLRDKLERLVVVLPKDERPALMLARLLAASPDDGVRDGQRALEIAQSLFDRQPYQDQAEALAMAHAELGQFDQAVALEENALATATEAGRFGQVPTLLARLESYRNRQPLRVSQRQQDASFQLSPTDASPPFRDYPASFAY